MKSPMTLRLEPRRLRVAACFTLAILGLSAGCRTFDATRPLRRLAFGSCAKQSTPQPIWDAVVATRPDVFLFLGDNIYADTEDMAEMQAKYNQLAGQPGYQRLRAGCPILATWDDHDYGVNDGGAEYPKKSEAQRLFLEFFAEPKDSPRWNRPGVYEAYVFGPPGQRVQLILLDTRYFRGKLNKLEGMPRGTGPFRPSTDTSQTLLGEPQWTWLEQQLRVPAEVRIIGSSIQLVAEDHDWEKWMNLPHERERFFRLIRDTGAAGTLVISGDRHLAELSMMDAGVGYPIYDLTSSGLNYASKTWRPYESNRHRVATMNQGDNFGLIEIDWNRSDPDIRLEIRDQDGDVTIRGKIALSTLQPGVMPR